MPSDIDVYQPPVEPPRRDEPGHPPIAEEGGDPPVTEEPAPSPQPEAHGDAPVVDTPEPPSSGDELEMPSVSEEVSAQVPDVISASSDDLTVSLTQARPDPLLGAFVTEDSADQTGPAPIAEIPADEIQGHGPHPGSRADAMLALGSLNLGGDIATTGAGLSGTSSDALAGIAFNPDPSIAAPAPVEKNKVEDEDEDEEDEDDDDSLPPPRSSLAMMLLASYASAVTLGLIWVLWTGRRLHEAPEPEDPPVDTRSDPGSRAGNAHRITAPKPIAAEHLATLGKTVRLGQIEATPLSVTSGPVVLERNFQGHQTKTEGENALKLRLRLRNASADAVIAPLDEAFVRDRPRADPDSYIETTPGTTPIAQYPLAVESEWSIIGQQFRDLKPGETLETVIVSAPDALAKKAPEMTWRIRLRTDLNHTDDLGVRFSESDIKPGP